MRVFPIARVPVPRELLEIVKPTPRTDNPAMNIYRCSDAARGCADESIQLAVPIFPVFRPRQTRLD